MSNVKATVDYEYFKEIEEKAKKYDELKDPDRLLEIQEKIDNLIIDRIITNDVADTCKIRTFMLDKDVLLDLYHMEDTVFHVGDMYKTKFEVREDLNEND